MMKEDFVYNDRNISAMECAKGYIERGITPIISSQKLEKGGAYKKVDRYLQSLGYKRIFIPEEKNFCDIYKYIKEVI